MAAVVVSERCLVRQRPDQGCRACSVACAIGAITITGRQVAINRESCVGCGRCGVACPLGAIALPGADHSLPIPAATIECGRVPAMSRRAEAHVVPCLGGISEQALLKFVADGGRKLVIMDRDWCEACAAGRCAAPWQDSVDKVHWLLGEMGRVFDPRIEVIAEPLPPTVSLPLVSIGAHAANMSRRQIFARVFSPPSAIPAAADGDQCVAPHAVIATALTNRSALLLRINADEPLPGSLFPAISLLESCCGNLMCATTCPTVALAVAKNGVATSLSFDAALCINCGNCSAICPTGSLELRARGDDSYAGRFELHRHARAFCGICDSEFNPDGEDERCPACRADRELAAAGFGLMRRKHPGRAGFMSDSAGSRQGERPA